MEYLCLEKSVKKEIIELINNIKDIDTLNNIKEDLENEQIHIKDFIKDLFSTNYWDRNNVYDNEEVRYAFEYTVRKICLDLGFGVDEDSNQTFKFLRGSSDYINHWCELNVTRRQETPLEIWIDERGYLFNTKELCWVVYNIYIKKVVFR